MSKKEIKQFLRKLLICIIINQVLQGNITLSEVYELIDKTIEAKRIRDMENMENRENRENRERSRNLQIQNMNNHFQSISQRQRQSPRRNIESDYKSYFSTD